jgi:hypothetical protein
LEDADMKKKPDSVEIETKSGNKKPVARAKGGLSFAKKLIRPRPGEDSRPIKKFNQVSIDSLFMCNDPLFFKVFSSNN